MAYSNYAQTDPRWAGQRLGTVDGWTLGQYGCYVVAQSNIAEHFGHDCTPADLDNIFTDRGLYVDGGLCWDGMLSQVYPDIRFDGVYHCEGIPCDLGVFNEFNNYEHEALIELDASPAPGEQTHFNRFYDYDPSTGVVRIIDSQDGQLVSINERYGDPATVVLKVVKFVGPSQSPVQPAPVTPPSDPVPDPPVPTMPVSEPATPASQPSSEPEQSSPPVSQPAATDTAQLPKVDSLSVTPQPTPVPIPSSYENPVNTTHDTEKSTSRPFSLSTAAKAYAGAIAAVATAIIADPKIVTEFQTHGWKGGLAAVYAWLLVYFTKNQTVIK